MTLISMQGTFTVQRKPPPSGYRYVGFVGIHTDAGPELPAIIPEQNPPRVLPLGEAIQWMSYNLMLHFCPTLTKQQWHKLHYCQTAMTNQAHGYEHPQYNCGAPHPDYINGTDLNATKPLAFDKIRTYRSTFMRAERVGDQLLVKPGIHAIDARGAMPSIQTIVDNNWFVYAVNTGKAGNTTNNYFFGQGGGLPTVYPFITDRDVYFKASDFMAWESNELPDPLRVY